MSLCAAVIADVKYQKYLPLFSYFCLKSYGAHGVGVKLFLFDTLKPKYRDILIKISMLGRLDIVEEAFSKYPKADQELKTARWLLRSDSFKGYDNVYIGDADLIICRESAGLERGHLGHCYDEGLPYSNMVRPNSKNRMSGLHFFQKDAYYKIMDPIIDKYEKLLLSGALSGQKNETTLYNMLKEGAGLPRHFFWSHHGIHLGYWRNGRRKKKISDEVWNIVDKSSYLEYYKFYREVCADPLFKEVFSVYPIKEVKYMDEYLSKEFPVIKECL